MGNIQQLRKSALEQVVHEYHSLATALSEIKFIQYDPIRKPLRAQDLILLQRVKNYKPGDLDTYYPNSAFEENCLHVYGALSQQFECLLYPRPPCKKTNNLYQPNGLAADVLNLIREQGEVLARDITCVLGREQITNAWGGKSAATTRALEELHYHGFVRVSKRIKGNKVYQPSIPVSHDYSPEKRLALLTLLIVKLLAPVSETGLRRAIGQLCTAWGGLEGHKAVIPTLLESGEIKYQMVDGVRYYLPLEVKEPLCIDDKVRFLAPFDPVVWDRTRFEHLWGWNYRFEAYIPQHLRQFGYYALPMFWRDQAIGWVNISKNKKGTIDIDRGFIKGGEYGHDFEQAYEREVSHFEKILSGKN